MKRIAKRSKKRLAQQLIEFLLVAPFLIIILAILTEYAYALNINMTLRQGLKTATSSLYKELRPDLTQAEINNLVSYNLITYLQNNNVPTTADNNITVNYVLSTPSATVNGTSVFIATYTYKTAFTLPNIFFHMLPDNFNFFATVAVPNAFLIPNSYTAHSTYTSATLDNIWSHPASFSSIDPLNAVRAGIVKPELSFGRQYILFMIPYGGTSPYYIPVCWTGKPLITNKANPTLTYLALNKDDGRLYTCPTTSIDPASCSPLAKTFLEFMASSKTEAKNDCAAVWSTNIIFLHDSNIPTVTDLLAAPAAWLNPSDATDLSLTTVTGALKRAIMLTGANGKGIGNFDNLDVHSYNSSASNSNVYNFVPFGSFVFMGTDLDIISKITSLGVASDYDYNYPTEE